MRKGIFYILLLSIAFQNLYAQQTKQITGKVVEEGNDIPLPGVTVSVKGTTVSAVTDVSGKYALKVPQRVMSSYNSAT